MKAPVGLNVVALVVGTTLFYTYIGQLVPQKQIMPPPVIEISSRDDARRARQDRRQDRARQGDVPDLPHDRPARRRAASLPRPRRRGGAREDAHSRALSQVHYFAQTLCEPDAYIVPGFAKGMPTINKPPIGLSDAELHAVIACLQSQGGEPTITLKDQLPYCGTAAAS